MDVLLDNRSDVISAFAHTLTMFVIAGVLSLIFGTILVAMRVGPVSTLRVIATTYVTVVRNTPLLIVLIFFRIAAPKIGIRFNFIDFELGDVNLNNIFAACVVGMTVYTSAFVCEALRSGINAVPLGQAEAARAIGLPFTGVMTNVVLPQSFRASVPPLASVLIAMLKNTTVCGALGVTEAFAQMRGFTNDFSSERLMIFLGFAVIFVVLVEIISFAAIYLERRWRVVTR